MDLFGALVLSFAVSEIFIAFFFFSIKIRQFCSEHLFVPIFYIQCPGMDQYGINCLSKAYEALPRQLADNSGNDPSKAISKLLAAHSALEGKTTGLSCRELVFGDPHLFRL